LIKDNPLTHNLVIGKRGRPRNKDKCNDSLAKKRKNSSDERK
jgi:hypothetical protein